MDFCYYPHLHCSIREGKSNVPKIKVETFIKAPIERCFDMARDIDIHCHTVKHTKEKAIAGVTSGKIKLGDTVTFEAVHFGIRQRLTSKIIECESPYIFVDKMQSGAFKQMKHVHKFKEKENGTLMTDILDFSSPFGIVGKAFDWFILKKYMRNFLFIRNAALKRIIEEEL
jgi:ligand-binding SRPBCC domain-containing protein